MPRAKATTHDLTDAMVRSAKPADKAYILWDRPITGLGVRINPTGHKTWLVRYWGQDPTGAPVRRMPAIGEHPTMTVSAAREKAVEVKSGAKKGADPLPQNEGLTVGELATKYKTLKRPQPGREDMRIIEKRIIPFWGKRAVAGVRPIHVTEWHAGIVQTKKVRDAKGNVIGTEVRGEHMADRALDTLKAIFNWSIAQGLIQKNPAEFVARNYTVAENERQYPWTLEERSRLNAVLDRLEPIAMAAHKQHKRMVATRTETGTIDEHLPSIWTILAIRFLIACGARKNEILKLRWDQITRQNGGGQIVWVRNRRLKKFETKNPGKHRTEMVKAITPGMNALLDKLQSIRIVGSPSVFPGEDGISPLSDITRPWYAIRDEAKISHPEWGKPRVHDIRHAYGQLAARAHLNEKEIMSVMSHASTQSSARYTAILKDGQAELAGQVDEMLLAHG